MSEFRDWRAGVVVGTRTIRVVYVEGYDCYDVLVDGECAKRIYQGGEKEAVRRAECARQLFMGERTIRMECPTCRRVIGVDRNNRVWTHNKQETGAGRIAEPCAGSQKPAGTRPSP